MDPFYPPVTETNIPLILELYESNPEYFNHPACPYIASTKDLFTGKSKVFDLITHNEPTAPMEDGETIEQITAIYNQIKDYGEEARNSDKAADKNTYFRVSVSLLERIVDLKERMGNLKHVNQFIGETMRIMEEVVDPEQKIIITERLKSFRDRLTS